MKPETSLNDRTFLWLVLFVSLAFLWIIRPFYGAVLWGIVIAVLFAPLQRRLCRAFKGRANAAALATVLIVIVIVIIPLAALIVSLVNEATAVYDRIQSGEMNFGLYFQQILNSLPTWATELLNRFEIANLTAVREKLSAGLAEGSQFMARQAISIGQNTFDFLVKLFVMLYLLFFLLRDGDELASRVKSALPLRGDYQRALFRKFIVVIRATVKGNMVVAILQGALGGLIFWLLGIKGTVLWAALMCILSLLPAVGAGIIWLPVAIYLLATSSVTKGIILLLYGVLVISLVDNVVRPILVGKDTKMPDYVVLISTLGGIAVFGINGFVIGPVIAAMFIAVWGLFSDSRVASVQPAVQPITAQPNE